MTTEGLPPTNINYQTSYASAGIVPKPSTSAPAVLTPRSLSPAGFNGFNGPVPNGHGVAQTARPGESMPNLGDMDAKCGGCQKVIDQESGGVVVAFGTSLWHVDCFRCAKCRDRVSADTNLLLLSDGSPVCGNCSYQCFVCKQAITEEAIMTGDESYHAHCFTCRTCKRRIEELVFAKTSQGIYCMGCHNERVARSRRHAEAKRQRAARKERDREEPQKLDEDARQVTTSSTPLYDATLSSQAIPALTNTASPLASPTAPPQNPNTSRFVIAPSLAGPVGELPPDDGSRSRSLGVDKPLPMRTTSPLGRRLADNMPSPTSPSEASRYALRDMDRSPQPRPQQTGMAPTLGSSQSLNTGSPSLSPSSSTSRTGGPNAGLGVGPVGLSVPTSKQDRRRSINPAMTFNMDAQNSTFAVEPRLSPLPPSPLRASFTDYPIMGGPRSPTSPSPQHFGTGGFPFETQLATAGQPVPNLAPRGSVPDLGTTPPPRTSSLPDQLSEGNSPLSNGTYDEHLISVNAGSSMPSRRPSVQLEDDALTPKLYAPDLPPMTFSLSDPDFAVILNSLDQQPPEFGGQIPRSDPGNQMTNGTSTVSTPNSPNETSSAIARSPQKDHMFPSVPEGVTKPSLPQARLSPNDYGSVPRMLRSRQTSAESTTSIASRFGPNSAFAQVCEMVAAAKLDGQAQMPIGLALLSGVIAEVEELKDVVHGLESKYTGAKRTSQQYSEGLTVAGEEYDKELAHRRELEAEVMRLRAQVHSQTARLSVVSGDEKRQESMRRRSNDMASNLAGLEKELSRLKTQKDLALAEVEELHANRNSLDDDSEDPASALSRSLTNRLDTIKEQYSHDIEPLSAQREALEREIDQLRESRDQVLEESTALAAKNEELAELNAQLSRQAENIQDLIARARPPTMFNRGRSHPSGSPSMSSLATSATLQEVPEETARVVKVTKPEPIEAAPARRFKWYKSSKGPDMSTMSASISKPLQLPPDRNRNMQRPTTEFGLRDHAFQQHSSMRFTKCELCQDKMWGLQEVRCASCGMVCHSKCAEKLPRSCTGSRNGLIDPLDGPLPPSMFGRELVEQVQADKLSVPVVVTKCISAVEVVGMEYEGIYRKTGGSSQSKQITQLFERGDYDAFDLADVEVFNDISSVTSVLKTYFRQLPNPLLTHRLHESFVTAASIRDLNNKHSALCALLQELPKDHYNTLRALMMHLNRITALASVNLMTSQNLGVVFGPTLMRSADPNREFGDMAGKALTIQWMVDNAPQVFEETRAPLRNEGSNGHCQGTVSMVVQ